MSTLLSIEISPRGEKSISRALGQRFIDHWLQNNPGGKIIKRDLQQTKIPYMDNDWISGVYAPPEIEKTPDTKAALKLSEELIAEIQAADRILISTPMYNFTIPALLKSWIDYVIRPGFTFKLAPGWPGMLEGKSASLVIVSRDEYLPGTPTEKAELVSPVLRQALGFMGIKNVNIVLAGGSLGVNRGVVQLKDHLAKFESEIAKAAKNS
jgi:FMN-dependent NADH-azoreductase